MTFLCLYISRWWRQTWNTPLYFTVVNQSEARISTEHGINTVYSMIYSHSFIVLCFVLVISSVYSGFLWSIYPYSSGLLYWHWGNHIASEVTLKDAGKWISTRNSKASNYIQLLLKSFLHSDAIWWLGSGSTLVQVMVCCLMAASHDLNQCWLITDRLLCHSP